MTNQHINSFYILKDANIITFKDDKINAGTYPVISYIEGDGIGQDIWPASKYVIDAAVEKAYNGTKKIFWVELFTFKGTVSLNFFNSDIIIYTLPKTTSGTPCHLVGGSAGNLKSKLF